MMRWRRLTAVLMAASAMALGVAVAPVRSAEAAPTPASCTPAAPGPAIGYLLAAADGGTFAFGGSRYAGGLAEAPYAYGATVGIAADPQGYGYWLATADGQFPSYGTTRPHPYPRPIGGDVVGIAVTPTGNGQRLAKSDGAVSSFGDAVFVRDATGRPPGAAPIVAIASTPTGRGYWLAASDGGVFSFGDARFMGSMGATRIQEPVVGMAATPTGGGYWLVARDGGVFSFGDAHFFGSTGNRRLTRPVVGMAATPSGGGYWLVAEDGGVFSFGDAPFFGSTGNLKLASPIVGMAATAGPARCTEWPAFSPPDLHFSVAANSHRFASEGEAFFSLAVENRGGDPAYIQQFTATLVDHTGKVVWRQLPCVLFPAVVTGGWRLAPNAVVTSRHRYPTEISEQEWVECAKAAQVPPGSYELFGTLAWCAKAYETHNGWWCEEPTTTHTERVAVEITQSTGP